MGQIRTGLTGKSRSRSANRQAWVYQPARALPSLAHLALPHIVRHGWVLHVRCPVTEQAGPLYPAGRLPTYPDATTGYALVLDATVAAFAVRRVRRQPTSTRVA